MSWLWWRKPVIPATQEAEAGESLEPWEAEAAVSQVRDTALQPGKQSETLSQNKRMYKVHSESKSKMGTMSI